MIPTFEEFLFPLLKSFADCKEHSLKELVNTMSVYFKLSEEDKLVKTRKGSSTRIYDRVQWSATYLKQAGLIESITTGVYKITANGVSLLNSGIKSISRIYLATHYESFREFQNRKKGSAIKQNMPKNTTPKIQASVNDSQHNNDYGSNIENLMVLKDAIRSLKKLGLDPSYEQIMALEKLQLELLTHILSPKIKELYTSEISNIIEKFVLAIKFDRGNIRIKFNSNTKEFDEFSDKYFSEITIE